jgi:hypothetical protein
MAAQAHHGGRLIDQDSAFSKVTNHHFYCITMTPNMIILRLIVNVLHAKPSSSPISLRCTLQSAFPCRVSFQHMRNWTDYTTSLASPP